MEKLKIYIIPMLKDNYSYILHDIENNKTAVIDPANAKPIIKFLNELELGLELDFILNTHHHSDHIGGNKELHKRYPNAKLITSKLNKGKISNISHFICKSNEKIKFGNFDIECISTPGHTMGSLCFYIKTEKENILFTGDTLFNFGCGRNFEGSAHQLFNSLNKLKILPLETKIYSGHEYTLKNLEFCMDLQKRCNYLNKYHFEHLLKCKEKIEDLRNNELPSVPTLLEDEIKINPFFKNIPIHTTFALIRNLKNSF
ncbi:Metallo-beta-lactamase superfamily [seawater metagenome]|uniref:hydroxyacylglutathione hydrolase n=1 Tax=seawater metagenome TaxID=1561972 RepID=A0A5E8CM60_9ZZZZ